MKNMAEEALILWIQRNENIKDTGNDYVDGLKIREKMEILTLTQKKIH